MIRKEKRGRGGGGVGGEQCASALNSQAAAHMQNKPNAVLSPPVCIRLMTLEVLKAGTLSLFIYFFMSVLTNVGACFQIL